MAGKESEEELKTDNAVYDNVILLIVFELTVKSPLKVLFFMNSKSTRIIIATITTATMKQLKCKHCRMSGIILNSLHI